MISLQQGVAGGVGGLLRFDNVLPTRAGRYLLRQGIHLRGYAQKQPKQEYKREAFELFGQLLDSVKNEVTRVLMNVKIESSEQIGEAAQVLEERAENISNVTYTAPDEQGQQQTQAEFQSKLLAPVGRNEPCPCGSGKKYKFCHGKLA